LVVGAVNPAVAKPFRPTITFAVRGPIGRADLAGLSDRVCHVLAENAGRDVWCVVRCVEPDAVTVEALARLRLAAGRYGCRVWLRGASPELIDVIELLGLRDVLRV